MLPTPPGVIKPEFVFSSATPPPPSDEEYTPLENAVFRRLLRYSKLEKIVRIIATHNFMRKLMKPQPPTLANSVMLLQPKFMDLLKQFKPSPNEMSEAFLKLVKTSQSFYPPSSKYFKPVVTNSIAGS